MKWLAINWFLGNFHRMFSSPADWLFKGHPNVISHFQARRSNHNRENKSVRSASALYWKAANAQTQLPLTMNSLCWKSDETWITDQRERECSHGFRGSVRRTLFEGQAQKHGRRRLPGVKPFLWSELMDTSTMKVHFHVCGCSMSLKCQKALCRDLVLN